MSKIMYMGNEYARSMSGFDTPETVTFPFTATKDGIAIAVVTPPASAVSYVYVNEDGAVHCRGASSSSYQYTLVFPVKTGRTYTISTASNYSFNNGVRLYPFGRL